MMLATFGEIASFVDPRSGQRLPIRYAAYALDEAGVQTLASTLLDRVGDGGWARQLPRDLPPAQVRPLLYLRMATLAGPGVTFAGAGARLLLDLGATAQWTGDLPIGRIVGPGAGGEGIVVEEAPRL